MSVDFPASESRVQSPPPPPPNGRFPMPFRRISLPSAPSLLHRHSVVSIASFDSLPEEESGNPPAVVTPRAVRHRSRQRPGSIDLARKKNRRSTSRPVDETRLAKRRKIIEEFHETERSYVNGLDLIYSHFLTPIVESLDTPHPLLDRGALTSIFSNFIDIWNLHRSFFSSLTAHLYPGQSPDHDLMLAHDPPSLSPVLLSHFPYLSLYTPFVTAFSSTISSLQSLTAIPTSYRPNPSYNYDFHKFVATQEADPRCGKLKLTDWLLTIVQRCPRYLLLLKDLIACTDDDTERVQLDSAYALVSKITLSLNASLHTHSQTLALLALQRSTANLPFQLISPGRTFIKRGPLFQIERGEQPKEREFLLFSDCLLWLASEESEHRNWGLGAYLGNNGSTDYLNARPPMVRTRSKSDADVSRLQARAASESVENNAVSRPSGTPKAQRSLIPPPSSRIKRHGSQANAADERWTYKGRASLVDLEVIVSPAREPGEERRLEVLSPEGSFVLFADTETERDEWAGAIRTAKAQLLVSLNVTHPNSTLTSSASTNHLRRTLQALPYAPEDGRMEEEGVGAGAGGSGSGKKGKKGKGEGKKRGTQERRGKVEHWVPAIWIPDEKTEGCMRCGRSFGWRRRRHHCRLCGRCVCSACSERTFFIADVNPDTASSKPARACNACYETVFPLLDPPSDDEADGSSSSAANTGTLGMGTLSSLTNLPSWMSTPILPLAPASAPDALMAIDRDPATPRRARRSVASISEDVVDLSSSPTAEGGALRRRSFQRPRSYHQILEDFDAAAQGHDVARDVVMEEEQGGEAEEEEEVPTAMRREDTARRHKRFSLPAVALHTTSVTARTTEVKESGKGGPSGVRGKRFSLVLSGRHGKSAGASGRKGDSPAEDEAEANGELGRGVAAGKLSELLGRHRASMDALR
ncbi:hypothetical protein GGG16DRAFT_85229 [Schizophyllum commune]